MDWFEKVKRYYDLGFYTNDEVKIFVKGKKITPEQYFDITKEQYVQ